MNILYCGDQGIARGVLVSILSLLKNGRKRYEAGASAGAEVAHEDARADVDARTNAEVMREDASLSVPEYHIYIMTVDCEGVKPFEAKTAKFLDRLVKGELEGLPEELKRNANANNFVRLIDATEVFVRNLPSKNMGTYFTPCAMLRLYMDKVPELRGLDRVLYLDYDVVCRGEIAEFYNVDLEGVEVAGALDIYGRRWYHYRGLFRWKKDAGVVDMRPSDERYEWVLKQDYMNSGVMLFNLAECRKTGMLARARKLCVEKRMLLPDQAALNKAIQRRKLMPRKYNEQGERPRKDTVLHHFSNNFKFWPYFRVQKVKPFEVQKIHGILKITEYDGILDMYSKLKGNL